MAKPKRKFTKYQISSAKVIVAFFLYASLLMGCTTIIDPSVEDGNPVPDTIFDITPKRISFDTIPEPEYYYPSKNQKELKHDFDAPMMSLFSKVLMFDPDYIGIKYDYFIQFNRWWWSLRSTYLKLNNTSFDCDNYAFLYKSLLNSAVIKAPQPKQILVGVIVVTQKTEALGIPSSPDLKHALCIVYTSKGWFVIEPQTNKFTPLKEYPITIYRYIF
jgi:hypothetical protein